MAAYADYAYYTGSFGGAALSETDFTRLNPRASMLVNRMTRGRAEANKTDDSVKMASCAVTEALSVEEQNRGMEVASESNDGLSIAYVATNSSAWGRMVAAASPYLSATSLMGRWC